MSNQLRQAALATKHGKESTFRPAFATIGVAVIVADVDTDQFGTFAGEIERQGSPRETVERKARAGIKATGLPIGLASEGSFGPHPSTPFLLADIEIVAYVDDERGYCVFESARSISTVPAATVINEVGDVDRLKITNLFPHQRAIVVVEDPTTKSRQVIAKGIDTIKELKAVAGGALANHAHPVIVEPDLRAHHCPDRRTLIRSAVDRLVKRLQRTCPWCNAAGFGPIRTIPGLRCSLCGLPTTQVAADVLGCTCCGFETDVVRVGEADPTYCDRCNP